MNDIVLQKFINYFKDLFETFNSEDFTPGNIFMIIALFIFVISLFFSSWFLWLNLLSGGIFIFLLIWLILLNS